MDDSDSPEIPRKLCPACQQMLPLTSFYCNRKGKDGYRLCCKICKKLPKKLLEPTPEGYKRCSKCENIFLANAENFFPHNETKDKLRPECKSCWSQLSKRRYQSNKEQARAKNRAYYETHHEQIKAHSKAYYKANAAIIEMRRKVRDQPKRKFLIAQHREYYKRHRDEIMARRREQYRSNPAFYLALIANRRTIRRGIAGAYTPEQIQEQLKHQKFRCYYAACDFAKFEKKGDKYIYHIDHTFPVSRVIGTDIPANDISYLVLTCPSCNTSKKDKYPWEFPEGGRLL